MRIAFYNLRAHGLFDPADLTVFGGAEVQLFHLSTELAARGHEVLLVTRGPGPAKTRIVDGVKVCKIPARFGRWAKCLTLWDTGRVLRACRAQVYVQRCAGVETALVAALARLVGARFCFMTASLLDCRNQLPQEGHPWVFQTYLWGLRRADTVICQNEEQQQLLLENFSVEAFILPSACAPVEEESPSAPPEGKRYVLWVGRCDPYKDPISFVRLARELPQIRFRMILPHTDHLLSLKVQSESMDAPNLEIIRGVSFFEMEDIYRNASVLVNTSTLEGFPNTFLEAMRVGVPLLSYRLDPGGVLRRERVGVCVEGDFTELVNCCRTWSESPDQARKYGEAGRNYVRQAHDARVVVTKFEHYLSADSETTRRSDPTLPRKA